MRCRLSGPQLPAQTASSRQMRLSSGGERGNLLLVDMDPFDLALAPDGIGQAIQAVHDVFRFGSDSVLGGQQTNVRCHSDCGP
jgi:hypothetical protein